MALYKYFYILSIFNLLQGFTKKRFQSCTNAQFLIIRARICGARFAYGLPPIRLAFRPIAPRYGLLPPAIGCANTRAAASQTSPSWGNLKMPQTRMDT